MKAALTRFTAEQIENMRSAYDSGVRFMVAHPTTWGISPTMHRTKEQGEDHVRDGGMLIDIGELLGIK